MGNVIDPRDGLRAQARALAQERDRLKVVLRQGDSTDRGEARQALRTNRARRWRLWREAAATRRPWQVH